MSFPIYYYFPLPYSSYFFLPPKPATPTQPQSLPACDSPPSPDPRPSRFKYPKKNVESNVINQIFSFLSAPEKSGKLLLRLLGSEAKKELFYELMKLGRRSCVGYRGRNALMGFIELEHDHPIYKCFRKLPNNIMRIRELKRAIRLAVMYFLRQLAVPSLLTSSKLDKSTLKQHLSRIREILNFISGPPSQLA